MLVPRHDTMFVYKMNIVIQKCLYLITITLFIQKLVVTVNKGRQCFWNSSFAVYTIKDNNAWNSLFRFHLSGTYLNIKSSGRQERSEVSRLICSDWNRYFVPLKHTTDTSDSNILNRDYLCFKRNWQQNKKVFLTWFAPSFHSISFTYLLQRAHIQSLKLMRQVNMVIHRKCWKD